MWLRLAADAIKVLFFPGLLFMAVCGFAALLLEGALARVVSGGDGRPWFALPALGGARSPSSPTEALAVLMPAAAMGVAGVLLVWVEGDLMSVVLLIAAPGLLPLMAMACGASASKAYAPLVVRESVARLFALACASVAVGMRYPGAFAAELEGFIAEGVFGAVRAWNGPGFALILSSQVCAVAALFIFLLGRPACGAIARRGSGNDAVLAAITEGSERAVTLLLFTLVCLGYPWKDMGGSPAWAASGLGMALLATAARALLEGRDAVFRRRALRAAPALSALSLALAAAATVFGG